MRAGAPRDIQGNILTLPVKVIISKGILINCIGKDAIEIKFLTLVMTVWISRGLVAAVKSLYVCQSLDVTANGFSLWYWLQKT